MLIDKSSNVTIPSTVVWVKVPWRGVSSVIFISTFEIDLVDSSLLASKSLAWTVNSAKGLTSPVTLKNSSVVAGGASIYCISLVSTTTVSPGVNISKVTPDSKTS